MGEFYGVQGGSVGATRTMIRVIRIGGKCGTKIFADVPEGLCARCVLKIALAMPPEASVAGVAEPVGMGKLSRGDAAVAPNTKKGKCAAELLGELGDYELLEEVGRGGQGVVFRARQKSLNRTVALKVISLGQWASKAHLKRFRLGAEAAARPGQPGIMPEQGVGNNAAISSLTDVYGLGAVLYQLLTGQPPFAGGTTYETIKLLLDTEPRPPRLLNPKIDRDLSTICRKCLEKDPKRRYSSALALAEDLERWLNHEPIHARRTGIFTRSRKWVRRNLSIAVMAAMLLALAVLLGVIVWKGEFPRQPVTTGIAVLPFENLSEQGENAAAFVDGVQDDVLTKLAKVADPKVISRTSVMGYRGKQNIRQIGDELRVSHVLEGSVRRTGTHLRLNARFITP